MKNKYIDMHIHSTNSDGELTPKDIINEAEKNSVEVVAITDHDTIPERSTYKSLTINNKNIKLVPGAELSTDYYIGKRKIRIHLLAYDAIDKDGVLKKELLRMKKSREKGNYAYIQMLLKKLPFLDAEDFKNFDYSKYGWIKKRILNHIDINKYSENQQKILLKCLEDIKPIYPKCTLELDEGIKLVKEAQGITSFAHPYQTGLEYEELDELVSRMKNMGLDAIETFHAEASEEDNRTASELAKKHELLESCGSDFHNHKEDNTREIGLGVNNNMKIKKTTLSDYIIQKKKYYFNGKYEGEDENER